MELTKHNLRLLIFEDVLHYHPECRGLIQPTLDAATAATTPVSDAGGGQPLPSRQHGTPGGGDIGSSNGSSRGRAASPSEALSSSSSSASLPPPPAGTASGSAATTGAGATVPPATTGATSNTTEAAPNAMAKNAAAAAGGNQDDNSSQGEAAWPPKVSHIENGAEAGWAGGGGGSDQDAPEATVMLSAVSVGDSGGDVAAPAAGLVTAL